MTKKYKTFMIQERINSINSFGLMKNNEISKIDIDIINEPIISNNINSSKVIKRIMNIMKKREVNPIKTTSKIV